MLHAPKVMSGHEKERSKGVNCSTDLKTGADKRLEP
tara:strand:- start:316 stop:423 length:108 start_codon:yes stop_codon:yes gene_type:complete